jgi:hypothetical protein
LQHHHPSSYRRSYTQALTDDPKPSTLPTQSTKAEKTTTSSTHTNRISFSLPSPPSSSSLVPQHPPQTGHTHPQKKRPHLFFALLLQKCDRGFGDGFFFKTSSFLLQDVDTPCTSSSSKNILAAYLPSPSTRYTRGQTTRSMNLHYYYYYYYYYYSSLLVWIRSIHDARAHVGAEKKTEEKQKKM